jgi:DNA-binding NarL/FixJ family response regulator
METGARILIVDDHPIVRDGLEYLISKENDLRICGYAENTTAALEAIAMYKPDIAIVDISLKGGRNGLELTSTIKELYPQLPVIILSMHEESIYAQRAIRLGARGYVTKHEMTSAIVQAIRKVMSGSIYLSESQASRLVDDLMFDQDKIVTNSVEKLTNKELRVFSLIGQGKKTSDIAAELQVSVKTIDTHRLRIKQKLRLTNSSELIKYAVEWMNMNI